MQRILKTVAGSMVLVLVVLLASGIVSAEPETFPVVEIRVSAEVPPFIRQACYATLRENGPQLRALLWPYALEPSPITVHLVTTREFQARMQGLPDWGVGAAWDDQVIIDCIRSLGIGRSVTHVFLHELAHCLIQQGTRMSNDVPRWFHEGVAQRVSGEWKFSDSLHLLLDGNVPDLRDLEYEFPRSAEWADQAYRTSVMAVMALEKRHGPEVIPRIIRETALRGFPGAFLHVTGETSDTFARNFRSSLSLRYRWPLMLARWPAMFVLLALVLLVGGSFKLLRSRRRLQQMSAVSPLWESPPDSRLWRQPEDREPPPS